MVNGLLLGFVVGCIALVCAYLLVSSRKFVRRVRFSLRAMLVGVAGVAAMLVAAIHVDANFSWGPSVKALQINWLTDTPARAIYDVTEILNIYHHITPSPPDGGYRSIVTGIEVGGVKLFERDVDDVAGGIQRGYVKLALSQTPQREPSTTTLPEEIIDCWIFDFEDIVVERLDSLEFLLLYGVDDSQFPKPEPSP